MHTPPTSLIFFVTGQAVKGLVVKSVNVEHFSARNMEEAAKSGIPELKSFVGGIERDYDAVKAALRLPWREASYRGQSQ